MKKQVCNRTAILQAARALLLQIFFTIVWHFLRFLTQRFNKKYHIIDIISLLKEKT